MHLGKIWGVPETRLDDALLASLPDLAVPAPWNAACEAVVWVHRASSAAREALPPVLRGRRPLLVVGAALRYRETPVGRYDEVLGAIVTRAGPGLRATVAFIAVDSAPSLVAGRVNWALPKAPGSFEGSVGDRMALTGTADSGIRWRVRVTPTARGPRLPVFARGRILQQLPEAAAGVSRLRGSGRWRPARVRVEVESAGGLATWLRPGHHRGALVDTASFRLEPVHRISRRRPACPRRR